MGDLVERARTGLTELYAWYAANGDDLYPLNRDFEAIAPVAQERMRLADASAADALVQGARLRGHAKQPLRAVAGPRPCSTASEPGPSPAS